MTSPLTKLSPPETNRRRHLAALTGLALVSSLFVALPGDAASADPTPAPSSSSFRPAAFDLLDAAKQEAKRGGRRVEIESLRTETSTTYANPDGKTLRLEMHTTPVRVKRDSSWHAIDTTLVADNGVIKPRMTAADLALSDGGDSTLLTTQVAQAKARGKENTAKLTTLKRLPAPKLSGNRAEYTSAYGPGNDLVVTATPTGFRQQIVIRERPAKPLRFRIPLDLPQGFSIESSGGKTVLYRTTGEGKEEAADISSRLMLDATAAGPDGGPDAGRAGRASVTVETDSGTTTLVLTPDAKFLADPAVNFPVTLAAAESDWWEPSPEQTIDTFVNNAAYTHSLDNQHLDQILVGKSNSGSVRWRSYIRFQDIPADSPLRGATVQNADLVLWNHLSNDCGQTVGSGTTVRRIISNWSSNTMTWDNQPSVTSSGAYTNPSAYSPNCTSNQWAAKEWDLVYSINAIAQKWADGEPMYGVQLTAGSESDITNWRRYRTTEYRTCRDGVECEGSPHQPLLFVDFEPNVTVEALAIPSIYDGPVDDREWSYEEALQRQVESSADPLVAPDISATDARAIAENATDTYEIDTASLPADEEDPGSPDVTPPTIIYTEPASSEGNVSTTAPILATFDDSISGAVVTVRDASGGTVAGSSAIVGEDKTAVFTPSETLEAGTTYTVEVSGAQDAAGNVMASPYTWSFTTAQTTTTPTPTPTGQPTEHTVSLPAQSDVWLDNLGTVESHDSTLWVGTYGGGIIERAYLAFDTASLAGKTITDAKLELWNNNSYGCGTSASGIRVRRVTSAWNANTVTWSNQPTATANNEVIANDPGGCTSVPRASTTWTWQVTDIARAWASGEANNGLLLRAVNESGTVEYDRGYNASEAPNRQPVLKVTYIDGPGSTISPTPSPPGGDSIAPTVVQVHPARDTSGVPVNTTLTVTFSEPVTNARVSLVDWLTEQEIPGSISMNAANTVLTFRPSGPLDYSFFEAVVSGARDAVGNTMSEYSWMFATLDWAAAQARSRSAAAIASDKPVVGRLWTRPAQDGHIVASTTPYLLAKPSDPLRRPTNVEFQIEHDPKVSSQGEGLIWSGTDTGVPSGSTGIVRIPEGKLANGWKVRWRSRATNASGSGDWSAWQSIDIQVVGSDPKRPEGKREEGYSALAAPVDFPYNRMSWAACESDNLARQKRLRSDGKESIGHTSNPYNWCASGRVRSVLFHIIKDQRTDAVISTTYKGSINFDFVVRAYTYAGDKKLSDDPQTGRNPEIDSGTGKHGRDISADWRIDSITTDPKGDPAYYNAHLLRFGFDVNEEQCRYKAGSRQAGLYVKDASISSWRTNKVAEWTFHSPKSLGTTKNLLTACYVVPVIGWVNPLLNLTPVGNYSKPLQRPVAVCDTSELITDYYGGCIFADVTPTLVFDATKDANIRESAKHVWDAYYHPDWTKPAHSPKNVPGRAPHGPLHRLVEGAVPGLQDPDEAPSGAIRANRSHSISVCENEWPAVRPKPDRLDCDEFPFASTREGSLIYQTDNQFSARYISDSDNRSSGSKLGRFYAQTRRLGADPFWVFAKPLDEDKDKLPVR